MRPFRDLLAGDALDVVMLDLSWCGGITEGRKIAALAQAYNRPLAPHDCTGPVTLMAGTLKRSSIASRTGTQLSVMFGPKTTRAPSSTSPP